MMAENDHHMYVHEVVMPISPLVVHVYHVL